MPKAGYKQTPLHRRRLSRTHKGQTHSHAHRAAIAAAMLLRAAKVREALAKYPPTKAQQRAAKLVPINTPVPPSASSVRTGHLERWACYSRNADGGYYYKREQADSLIELQKITLQLELPLPLFTYVKSATTEKELFMPIRIPEEAIQSLGHRFAKFVPLKLKERRKKERRG